jgi:hypothetical protein
MQTVYNIALLNNTTQEIKFRNLSYEQVILYICALNRYYNFHLAVLP